MVLSTLFFHTEITYKDSLVIPEGKWSLQLYSKMYLNDPIKLKAKSKDVSPLWGIYVEYPLPTE